MTPSSTITTSDGRRHGGLKVGDEERQRVADAADGGHGAADQAADPGVAAAGEAAIVGERLGEAHADAGADGGGQSDQEGVPGFVGGDGRGEDRRQGGDGAIHQAGQSGLDHLQHEEAAVGFLLLLARAGVQFVFAEFLGAIAVGAFL